MGCGAMDEIDGAIVDLLQDGLEVCERAFAAPAAALGIEEAELVGRLRRLREDGTLTRFGPMYDAERLGGAVTLAAMRVPPERFDTVAAEVNAFDEVAHNYEREHALNMWFVLATETPDEIPGVIDAIAVRTGCTVHDMPRLEEYYIGLRLRAGRAVSARRTAKRANDPTHPPEDAGAAPPKPPRPTGRATDSGQGCPTGSAQGCPTGSAQGSATGSMRGRATDSMRGRATDSMRGRATDSMRGRATDSAKPRSMDSVKYRSTDSAQGRAGLDTVDRAIVAATQAGLPFVPRPWHAVAGRVGIEAEEVMARLRRMLDTGAVRRIAAVPDHYALGYRANGMSVWDVDDAEVSEAGREIGALAFVSHCYRRPRHRPLWPYNLFAMVHGRSRDAVEARVAEIAAVLGPRARGRDILYSRRILKKAGLRLRPRVRGDGHGDVKGRGRRFADPGSTAREESPGPGDSRPPAVPAPAREAPSVPAMPPARELPSVPAMSPARELPSVPAMSPARELPSVPAMSPARELPSVPAMSPARKFPSVPAMPPAREVPPARAASPDEPGSPSRSVRSTPAAAGPRKGAAVAGRGPASEV